MDGMTSAMLLMDVVLDTTNLEMAIIIMMSGPVIDTMIGQIIVMGIVGAMRVGTAKMVGELSVILLLDDLATRSFMVLCVDPGERGFKGILVGVRALLLQDPVPVDQQQPQGILRRLRELPMAGLPHLGDSSTQHAKDPVVVGEV